MTFINPPLLLHAIQPDEDKQPVAVSHPFICLILIIILTFGDHSSGNIKRHTHWLHEGDWCGGERKSWLSDHLEWRHPSYSNESLLPIPLFAMLRCASKSILNLTSQLNLGIVIIRKCVWEYKSGLNIGKGIRSEDNHLMGSTSINHEVRYLLKEHNKEEAQINV